MDSFEERLKKAMEVAEQRRPSASAGGDELVARLETFAKALDTNANLFVHAIIEKGPHPQVRSLVTSPRYRRDQRTYMLRFWLEGQRLKPMNDWGDAPYLASTEDLENYLLDFFNLPAFQSALATYEHLCAEDVDAFLRTGRMEDIGPNDVLVLVPAMEQKRLVEATPGTSLDMSVLLEDRFPTTGAYEPDIPYVLSSAGAGMQIARHHKTSEGHIELFGVVLPPLYP